MNTSAKQTIERLLEGTAIAINGSNRWDMKVNNDTLYQRIITKGTLGLGEAYMEGWWDCEALDEFFFRILKKRLNKSVPFNLNTFLLIVKARLFNQQTKSKSVEVAVRHYDVGNDLFQKMLDKRMVYSCA